MKKILFTFALLAITLAVSADDAMYASDITIKQGKSATLVINLDNTTTNIAGWTWYIDLPDGITPDYSTVKVDETRTNGYNFDKSDSKVNGHWYLSGYNSNLDPITGNSGAIMYIDLVCDPTIELGEYTGTMTAESEVATIDARDIYVPASTFKITIVEDKLDLYDDATTAPAASSATENVVLHRNMTANIWNSFVVPFDMDATQIEEAFGAGAQVAVLDETWEVNSFTVDDVTDISLAFKTVTEVTANKPFIVKPSKAATYAEGISITGVNGINPAEAISEASCKKNRTTKKIQFTGVYAGIELGGDAATDDYKNQLYLKNNNFYFAAQNTPIKGYRAYIEMGDFYLPALFEVKMYFDEDVTAINGINADRTNGKAYSIDGKYVGKDVNFNRLQKGVYIVNGKKVIK